MLIRVFAAFLFATVLGACTSVPIMPSVGVEPPPGVTDEQVRQAIRTAISLSNRSSTWAGGSWAVERTMPDVIIAGLRVRTHYLQVEIPYSATNVSTRIISSYNLDQKGGRIHKRALAWQGRLEAYIYQELGKLRPIRQPVGDVDGVRPSNAAQPLQL